MNSIKTNACYKSYTPCLMSHSSSKLLAPSLLSRISIFNPCHFSLALYPRSRLISANYPLKRLYSSQITSEGKASYIGFHEASNHSKIWKTLNHTLRNSLHSLGIPIESALDPSTAWPLLQSSLKSSYEISFPDLDQTNPINSLNKLLKIFGRPFYKGDTFIENPQPTDYIFTPTELYWAFADIGVPFASSNEEKKNDFSSIQDIFQQCPTPEVLPSRLHKITDLEQKIEHSSLLHGEKDATAATLLALPYLDKNTCLYEIGCWHGQSILNLLFYASCKGKLPKYCLATDINPKALTLAQSVASLFALEEPFLQFRLANALFPIDLNKLGIKASRSVKLALRLLPVLHPHQAKLFLQRTRQTFVSDKDTLILSFALPSGRMYQENLAQSKSSSTSRITKEVVSEGVIFQEEFTPKEVLSFYLPGISDAHIIRNTYYTEEGFIKLIQEAGFKIQHRIFVQDADNDRCVVLLHPA